MHRHRLKAIPMECRHRSQTCVYVLHGVEHLLPFALERVIKRVFACILIKAFGEICKKLIISVTSWRRTVK